MGYFNFNYFQIQYSHTISSNPAMLRNFTEQNLYGKGYQRYQRFFHDEWVNLRENTVISTVVYSNITI